MSFFSLIEFLIFGSGAMSQAGDSVTIHGRILTLGEPAAYATALVTGTRLGAMADECGYFSIARVPVGRRSIRAQYIGCRSITVEVDTRQLDSLLVFNLEPLVQRRLPACEPYMSVDYFQGDHALPAGVLLCGNVYDDVKGQPAMASGDIGRLELIQSPDFCSAFISWTLKTRAKTALIIDDSSGKTVRVLSGPTRKLVGNYLWDGKLESGTSAPAGHYRVVMATARSTLELCLERRRFYFDPLRCK